MKLPALTIRLCALALLASLAAPARAQVPAYTFYGDGPGDLLGLSVSGARDVDKDGFDDVIVGAPYDDDNGTDSGSARVLSGRTGAILYTFKGNSAGDAFGQSVSNAGDVDKDGWPDLLVGAPGDNGTGSASILSGKNGTTLYTFYGLAAGDNAGYSVSNAGDVDKDGWADWIVGVPWADSNGQDSGSVYVLSGKTGGALYTFVGDASSDVLGASVSNAGDVNKDGWPDILAGGWGSSCGTGFSFGYARVWSGKDGSTLYTFYGNGSDFLGASVSLAEDVNADGYDDVVVGATGVYHNFAFNTGAAYVYSGKTGAILHTFYGSVSGESFASAVANAGDVDADGYADIAVSAPGALGPQGPVRVYSGKTGAKLYDYWGDGIFDSFGLSIAWAGDVNDDGLADLIVGAPLDDDKGKDCGSARILLSGCPAPAAYCTAKPNSQGCTPAISWRGVPSLTIGGDAFFVEAASVLNSKNGLLFWGLASASLPFGGGTLCVKPPTVRTPVQLSGGTPPPVNDCTGSYSFHFSQAYLSAQGLTAGTTVHAQYWSRDPGYSPPNNVGLTNAVKFTVCP
jgi:predicted lipoprotein with Yx(FWY)xxD motif